MLTRSALIKVITALCLDPHRSASLDSYTKSRLTTQHFGFCGRLAPPLL
jgi:hypothetical protein